MVRFSPIFTSVKIFLCAITLAFGTACTQKPTTATVSINFPSQNGPVSQNVTALATRSFDENWGLPEISGINDVQCYAVMVGGPDLNQSSCSMRNGGSFSFGPMVGLAPRGQSASISVPMGSDRVVYVLGYNKVAGMSCEQTSPTKGLTTSFYSPPHLIAKSDRLNFNSSEVAVQLRAAYSSTEGISNCNINMPDTGTAMFLGTGADGSLSVGSFTDLSLTRAGAPATHTRYLATTLPISQAAANGNDVKLTIPSNLPGAVAVDYNHFDVGDEVVLYVSAASQGNSSACGGEMYTGDMIFGRVTAPPSGGGTNYLNVNFSEQSKAVSLVNLGATPAIGNLFCKVSITRVPHLNRLIFNGAGLTLTTNGFGNFKDGSGMVSGGALILRVRDLIEVATSSGGVIDMSNKGYRGATANSEAGQGNYGYVTTAGPNGKGLAGGGYQPLAASFTDEIYPGGGGNGGSGGEGKNVSANSWFTNAGGFLGSNYLVRSRIFMGGGGGAQTASNSNHGGGIIKVIANKITVPVGSTLHFQADGGVGNLSAGGGGAGSILVRAIQYDAAGTVSFSAKGGDAGETAGTATAATGYPGAGGGGRLQIDVHGTCSGTAAQNVGGGITGSTDGLNDFRRTAGSGTFESTGPAVTQATCSLP